MNQFRKLISGSEREVERKEKHHERGSSYESLLAAWALSISSGVF